MFAVNGFSFVALNDTEITQVFQIVPETNPNTLWVVTKTEDKGVTGELWQLSYNSEHTGFSNYKNVEFSALLATGIHSVILDNDNLKKIYVTTNSSDYSIVPFKSYYKEGAGYAE